jgi:malonyl-CoA/methylmalonyl-CoA synthetase
MTSRPEPAARSENLFALIERAGTPPERAFMTLGDGRVWTYGETLEWTGRIASVLAERGVQPGDRVAVQVEKSPQAVMLYLACLRAGAVFLPLNPAYTAAEVDYFLGDAQPSLFVCRPAVLSAAHDLAARHGVRQVETMDADGSGSLIDAAGRAEAAFPAVERSADDLAAILYTSGTTGRSKGAMITHGNLASNARTLVQAWRFDATDVLIHALPIIHVHGLFVALNVPLLAGASLLFRPKFDAKEVLGLLPHASVLMGVPTFYVRLLQQAGLDHKAAARMRLFISGSAPLLADTHAAWRTRTGHAILERYGMTETGMLTSNPYDGERVAGTVGPALPGVDLRVVSLEAGAPLPQGEIGVIEVRGANVFKGYWRMPERTRAEFRDDGYFVTGDVGRIDERGYVHIVGRAKDLIISGGFNVYPKEVENELDAIPGVAESAVIGLPHPDFGEGVTAVVVPVPGAALDPCGMLATLEDRLAKYKLPKRIVVVPDLPRNAMGKVEKKALRERYADLYRAP